MAASSSLPLGLTVRLSSADMPMVSRLLELRGPGQGCAEEASSRFLSRSSRVPQGLIVFPQPRSGRQERGVEGRGDTGEGTMAVAGLGSRNHALRALAGTPRPALGKQPLFVAPPSASLLEASVAQGGQQAARGAPDPTTGPGRRFHRTICTQSGSSWQEPGEGLPATGRGSGDRPGDVCVPPNPPSPGHRSGDSPPHWMF